VDKQEMMYDIMVRIEDKLDAHIAKPQDTGITLKEWGIISGMVGVICTTIVTVANIIMG